MYGRIPGVLLIVVGFVHAGDALLDEYYPLEPFWAGKATLSYKAERNNKYDFFDPENNGFSATVTLATRIRFSNSWGLGLEAAGWSDLGLEIADSPRVSASITNNIGSGAMNAAEFSESYLYCRRWGARFRLGRQALSKTLSPWLWSDRSAGVLDIVYDGVTAAYADSDSSLWFGGWIARAVNQDDVTRLGREKRRGVFLLTRGWVDEKDETFLSAYLVRHAEHLRPDKEEWRGHDGKDWSLWASRWHDDGRSGYGAQLVYADGQATGARPTLAAALRWQIRRGAMRWRITLAGINGGDYSLKSAGMGVGSGAFWGSSVSGEFGSDSTSNAMGLARVDWRFALSDGNYWYASMAAADYAGEGPYRYDRAYGARLGRRFRRGDLFGKVEYRFRHMEYSYGSAVLRQRLRVDLGMNF